MKIGIFGGSFDPIHNGHIRLAQYAVEHTDLNQLWLMVSPRNPLKDHGPIATDGQRLEMARLAVDGIPGIEVSDFEFHLPKPSYTYLTLTELQKAYPDHQFRLLIGGDNWANFQHWRHPEEIIQKFGLIVYPRPGEEIRTPPNLSSVIDNSSLKILRSAPQMPVSSTQIRKLLKENLETSSNSQIKEELSRLLPQKVLDYIHNHNLYLP